MNEWINNKNSTKKLIEARKVAGSAKYKHSKTEW